MVHEAQGQVHGQPWPEAESRGRPAGPTRGARDNAEHGHWQAGRLAFPRALAG